MLSEINPTEKVYDLTYMWNPKKVIEKEIRPVTRGERLGEGKLLDEGNPKVQTSSYNITKYQGCNTQHDDYG